MQLFHTYGPRWVSYPQGAGCCEEAAWCGDLSASDVRFGPVGERREAAFREPLVGPGVTVG